MSDHDGLIASADGGILFLDEIGDLPIHVQTVLLKALEMGRFRPVGSNRTVRADFRLVAATRRDLKELIQAGEFRRDLRHRLGVAEIELVPLRRRGGDIEMLARAFLRERQAEVRDPPPGLTRTALAALEDFSWPGNVRQLKQVVRAAAALARGEDEISEGHVREVLDPLASEATSGIEVDPDLDLETAVADAERQTIRRALERSGGNRAEAAELLGIGESTLYRKLPLGDGASADTGAGTSAPDSRNRE